ncbi:MAG: hypothetical protein F6K28_45970 [Microcoleus sp. SIO2G3]|nr:hypothetical protein [Microcoleus sp. SIO2G3]
MLLASSVATFTEFFATVAIDRRPNFRKSTPVVLLERPGKRCSGNSRQERPAKITLQHRLAKQPIIFGGDADSTCAPIAHRAERIVESSS